MILKETDLHQPLFDFFTEQEYKVHCEVKDVDMTAEKDGEIIAIELKRSLNLSLLVQGTQRQLYFDSVYIAVPHPRQKISRRAWKQRIHLIKQLELGLLLVSWDKQGKASVEVKLHPEKYKPRKNIKKQKSIIREITGRSRNYNVAGSHKTRVMTAYRERAIHIACCLEQQGPLSPAKLKKLGTDKSTQSILSKNYYGWFEKIERGIYQLHPTGRNSLEEFQELANHYRLQIKDA